MDIYVGNLSFQFAESDLQELFQEFGEIKAAKLISDKVTGKSKGFGFVTMENDEEAQAAIDKLNGTPVDGRNIIVNQARPKTENRGGYGGGGGNRAGYGNRDRGGDRDRGNRY